MKIRDIFRKYSKKVSEKLPSSIEATAEGIKLPNYRIRLIAFSLLIVLLTQAVYITNVGLNTRNATFEIKHNTDKEVFYRIYSNCVSRFNNVERIITTLSNATFSDYVRNYANLREDKLVKLELEKLNKQIDSLNISPEIIEKIYILGSDSYQRNYIRSMGQDGVQKEDAPWLDDLMQTEMFAPFFNNSGVPIFFEKNQLKNQLQNALNKSDPAAFKRVGSFVDKLEGKLVICRYYTDRVKSDYAIAAVLNSNFFNNQERESAFWTLLDQYNQVIYSDLPAEANRLNTAKLLLDKQMEGEWKFRYSDLDYSSNFKIVSPYGLKLIYTSLDEKISDRVRRALLFDVLLIMTVTCLITFLFSYILSVYITSPFAKLSLAIEQQARAFPIEKIDPDTILKYPFKNLPINRKILYFFILSVLLPVLFSGLAYSAWLYNYTKEELRDSVISISSEMSTSIGYKLNTYMNLMNQLTATDMFSDFLNRVITLTDEDKKQINLMMLNHISSLGDIPYMVLLDSYGAARYQSIYPDNPERFKVTATTIANEYQTQKSDLFWIPKVDNVFNEPSLVLVKKITSENGAGEIKTVGYLQMFLKESIFQSIKLNHKLDFCILNERDKLVFQSNQFTDYTGKLSVVKESFDTPVNTSDVKEIPSIRQIVRLESIDEQNWKIYVFQSLDDAFAKSKELYMRNLIVVFIILLLTFLLAWWISKLIVKPIQHLENEMKKNYDGNLGLCMEYNSSDEIGQLVKTYNQMIEQINKLMDENISSKVREQELMTLKTKAELNMLQQQINPHFLYNTLEAIKTMTIQNKGDSASKMVSALAQIFRFSVNTVDKVVMLEKEIEYVQNYIMIQKMRFGEKFNVKWDLDEGAMPCKILKLILQPIVENSINHGLYEFSSGGIIEISAKLTGNVVVIRVSDNGMGMRPVQLENLIYSLEKGSMDIMELGPGKSKTEDCSVGLKNVYSRLKMFYEGKAEISIESRFMQGTSVQIVIPYEVIYTN